MSDGSRLVRGAITGSGASASVTVATPPTAGNVLIAFGNYVGTGTPTFSDNLSSTWTVYTTTSALYNSSGNSIYAAYRVAVSGDSALTSITTASGTVQGMTYLELSGAATGITNAVATNNQTGATSLTTAAFTTGAAGMVITCVGNGTGGNGGATAWTGTHVMTSVATSTTRCYAGYYSSAAGESAQTYTANWTTSRTVNGALTINVGPSGAVNNGAGFLMVL